MKVLTTIYNESLSMSSRKISRVDGAQTNTGHVETLGFCIVAFMQE